MQIQTPHRQFPAKGCYSETAKLTKVVMCSPTQFQIVDPINYTQSLYFYNGHPRPRAELMTEQHQQFVQTLQAEGIEVRFLPSASDLPYQHATRDLGTVIGDTIILSSLKERTRQRETQVAEPLLCQYRLHIIKPLKGIVEGGDIAIDGNRLWVGLGARTDKWGADFLYQTFERDYEIIPLELNTNPDYSSLGIQPESPQYTHLDLVFAVLGRGHVLLYEPAFTPASLKRIRQHYPLSSFICLEEEEQRNAGANVLCLDQDTVLSITENCSVNDKLRAFGYKVIETPFSEVIKSGGSVRCDTLPIERDD